MFLAACSPRIRRNPWAGMTCKYNAIKNISTTGVNNAVVALDAYNIPLVQLQHMTGFRPLHVACRNGHPDVVRALLRHGADPNCTDRLGFTPLHIASRAGQDSCVQLLLETAGINVNMKTTRSGCTPLHLAAYNNHSWCVKALLDMPHIDVLLQASNGQTAVAMAEQYTNLECAVLLHRAAMLPPLCPVYHF